MASLNLTLLLLKNFLKDDRNFFKKKFNIRQLPVRLSADFGLRSAAVLNFFVLSLRAAASAAVDLRRRIAQGERLGVVAQVQLGEVEHVAHVLRERGVRPHKRHVTFESNRIKVN